MPVLLCDEELQAMQELPHLHRCLYIFGIRRYMDYQTGITGIKRKISYKSLSEEVYVLPQRGYLETTTRSKEAIRRAVKVLEKTGLIIIKSSDKNLILECVLAQRDKSVQNKADTRPTPQPDTEADTSVKQENNYKNSNKINLNNDKPDTEADIPLLRKADIHPVSGKYIKEDDDDRPLVDNFRKLLADRGFYLNHLINGKTLEMFQAWIKDGVTAEEAKQAMDRADAQLGARPNAPSYYRNIPYQIREEFKQAQNKAEETKNDNPTGKRVFTKHKSKTEIFYDNVLPGFKDYVGER
jgi:hypothetical protein